MSAWPFEPIAEARRRLEVQRTRMMSALAAWTSGAGSYDEVCTSIAAFDAQLASFKDVIHALRDEPGMPRQNRSRFDDEGNITPQS